MTAKQQIYKVRRTYNQWVNNQTLEDYALRFTAKASRRWSLARVANTALGAISFLALEAIGAAITISYGFDHAFTATLVVGSIIFLLGLPICYYAAKYGVDIDLLTRGAGFGYIGSTATSLIYACFTFIFFALEAAIMAKALELTLSIPIELGYLISSIVVIPLVFYGITFISRFQLWTQPLWLVLQLMPLVFVLYLQPDLVNAWTRYTSDSFFDEGNIAMFGACSAILFSLVAQIGEQVDFLRFLPPKSNDNRIRWWLALISAGPGWIVIGCIKILIGSFLAVVSINLLNDSQAAIDPTSMYTVAYGFVTGNHSVALAIAGIFVVISQLKINVTNAYAGSIAWSNFFSRLTHSHPGRVVWLVFNVVIALLLMELGIYHAFENTLSVYAIVAVSWVGALVSDLIINKPLGFSPKHIEFRRAYLYDINPVGTGSTLIASCIGISAYLGWFGLNVQALAHFLALASSFVLAPIIAWLTKGKFYIARTPHVFSDKVNTLECCICQNHYEAEDLAACPAYEGSICSLCCSLDSRCQDLCKPQQNISKKIIALMQGWLPSYIANYINARFIHFVLLLCIVASVTGLLLTLIYSNSKTFDADINLLLAATLWKVFFILLIIAGVICWLFILAHQSQVVAQEESLTQTKKLINEINAHENTDSQLQQAKEQAEAANNAKSRYLTGISHELRSPLNTILGYAQLMHMDSQIPSPIKSKISVIKRSGEHLSNLIEGLLDISQIEAGRLYIQRKPIYFSSLLDQIEKMFHIQTERKSLRFCFEKLSPLPNTVIGDEKRLRQILINVLSNAVKFTATGEVKLSVRYRNQVAEFKVYDSGIGIDEDDLDRIFKPFERIRKPGYTDVIGTGLGLTITRLLTDIMGGEISYSKNPDGGSIFTVSLMLSTIYLPENEKIKSRAIVGYKGPRKFALVVDDDATHRGLTSDLLTPLGFSVAEAHDGESCLKMVCNFSPDVFLIDRKMQDIDGLELASRLRDRGFDVPILIISANAQDNQKQTEAGVEKNQINVLPYDDYINKPIKLDFLLAQLAKHLEIQWLYEDDKVLTNKLIQREESLSKSLISENSKLIDQTTKDELTEALAIGSLKIITQCLNKIAEYPTINAIYVNNLRRLAKEIKFDQILIYISETEN